ncbi:MAG: aldo/keto reductase [Burkholderiales bacterium]
MHTMVDRRDFISLSAATALAAAGLATTPLHAAPHIQRYTRLGRTELKVSDISFGSASSADPALVRYAFSAGINYFDSAESYRGGSAEEAIGEALKGKRQQVYLTSKTKAGASDTRAQMMKALEGSLKRLRTGYVDVYFNHAVNDVERMKNPEWREFTDLAKRQGKIRFRGMSGHGGNLTECLDYAIGNDLVDVVLVAYSFAHDPSFTDKIRHTFHWAAIQNGLPSVLEKAKKKDIGVIAMKTLMGGRMNDMRPYERSGGTFSQAAFRWTLSNPNVDALLVSMTSKENIDEYVAGSGEAKVSQYDLDLLQRYAGMRAGNYCLPGCNRCEESCPAGVAISEVLRTRMYAADYGDTTLAKAEYAALKEGASACMTCASQACLGSCPAQVPIARLTREAARALG